MTENIQTEEQVLFTDLGLSPQLLEALDEVGYKHPTPIQAQAIPYILMGRDVIGVAQTGTGKTASFTLPLLEILKSGKPKSRMPRALILAPTRELAAQIQENLKLYSKKVTLTSVLLVGGEAMGEQTSQIQRGVDVVIATPGRFMDIFQRGGLILTDTKFFIIDEADRMLDMGFIPDIEKIVGFLPKIRQTLMFTATMAPEIKKLAAKFLTNPKEVSVARSSSTAATISQFVYATSKDRKAKDLLALIDTQNPTSALVFCNRKTDVDKVKTALIKAGHKAEGLHGDMAQSARYASLERFKTGESKIIVCSDIAARGLDIDDVSHVVNYDVPRHAEDYVHRIGRTGRAGKTGHAITFVTEEDEKGLDAITKLIQQSIPVMPAFASARNEARRNDKTAVVKAPLKASVSAEESSDAPSETRGEPHQRARTERKPENRAESPRAETPRSETPRESRPAAGPEPKETKHERRGNTKPDNKASRKDSRRADPDDISPVGFGDDVPAFMRNGS